MTAEDQHDDTVPPSGDHLTVLTSRQAKLATKRIVASWNGPPTIEDYPRGSTWFAFDEWRIGNFDEMAAALAALQARAYSYVVRGRIIDGTNRRHALRRARARKDQPATLEAAARHWIAIDFDSIPCPAHLDPARDVDAVVEHVAALLPMDFHEVSCFWSFTSGQGFKPGLRLRLWYWANRPVGDRELKLWLGDSPIDRSLYAPAQPTYSARPIFAGVVDPVPFRCGVWHGYVDTVIVPPIEKPQARTFTNGTDGPFTNFAGGAGYEFHCGQIGDHDGGAGFFRPIKSAVAAWIAQHGATADTAWLREDLERIIRAAPRDPTKHPDDHYIEVRVADLDPLIAAIGEMEAAKEAEPVEPTYAPPPEGDTLDAARTKLALEMKRFTKAALAHIERTTTLKAEAEERGVLETYEAPAPPVHGVNAAVGLGKTRAWREEVAAAFVEQDQHPVLAVPRHRLGDEIVGDFTKAGIIARDFRGREYPDPEQPGKAMCHDLERIKAIEEAGGDISRQACHSKRAQCAFYDSCGYQQQRRERPDAWLMPHQLLTRPKPTFIKCDTLGIDESFWSVPLRGIEHRVTLELSALIIGDRSVPQGYRSDGPFDAAGTADLVAISRAVHDLIMAEPDGRLRRAELTAALYSAGVSLDDLRAAYRLEWARKIKLLDVIPGMPPATVKELCGRVAAHNRQVGKLGRFWKLLADTVAGGTVRSPWLDLRHEAKTHKDTIEPAVYLAWCDEIHETWRSGPTMVMDATMPVGIVQRFYPGMAEPAQITAPAPFVRVRQITDVPMSKNRLIPTSDQDTPQNRTRLANVERVRRYIEVRACEAGGKVAVICNEGLKTLLKDGALPGNVEIDHYNNVTGENRFADAEVLILIGRPEAPPLATELMARTLFETDIQEIAPDAGGRVNYPLVRRGIRRRDGSAAAVNGPRHPDPRVEEVRQAICEAELIQTAGRGRGINRTAANPLQIDILTNVVLPLAVDETTTWEAIQPRLVEVMRARGAVPFGYADAAVCYSDLFTSAEAARKALKRENPGQIAIELFYIAVCPGFLSVGYRRRGSRGPPGRLLYDPAKIDPQAWLSEKLGDVTVLPACQWFVVDEGRLRRCGAEVAPGMTWCAVHIAQSAAATAQDDHTDQAQEQAAAN